MPATMQSEQGNWVIRELEFPFVGGTKGFTVNTKVPKSGFVAFGSQQTDGEKITLLGLFIPENNTLTKGEILKIAKKAKYTTDFGWDAE